MKTEIFKNRSAFNDREDKKINGVSAAFAKENPKWADERNNSECWNCSDCSYCSYCSSCSYCSDCSDCSYCSYCSYCSSCSKISHIKKEKGDEKNAMIIPVVENIHQKIHEAVTAPGNALEMGDWHSCDTTHCFFVWAIHLPGDAGRILLFTTSAQVSAR